MRLRLTRSASRRLARRAAVSALLKPRLAAMAPGRAQGAPAPAINGLQKRHAAGKIDRAPRPSSRRQGARRPPRRRARRCQRCRSSLAPAVRRSHSSGQSQVIDEITAIFSDMGFCHRGRARISRPTITELHRAEFPARGTRRAKCTTPFSWQPGCRWTVKKVLRTHTSPVQIRAMQRANEPSPAPYVTGHIEPPIRIDRARAAPIATIPTRPTPRCSIRSRGW